MKLVARIAFTKKYLNFGGFTAQRLADRNTKLCAERVREADKGQRRREEEDSGVFKRLEQAIMAMMIKTRICCGNLFKFFTQLFIMICIGFSFTKAPFVLFLTQNMFVL